MPRPWFTPRGRRPYRRPAETEHVSPIVHVCSFFRGISRIRGAGRPPLRLPAVPLPSHLPPNVTPPLEKKPDAPKPPWLTSLRSSFEHTPRTLGLVWRSSRAGTVLVGILTLACALIPLGIAWTGKQIIDAVVQKSADATLRWVLVELGLVAALALGSQGLTLARSVIGARLGVDINVAILKKAIALDLRYFEDSEFYDSLTRARREASVRPLSVVTRCFQLV